ncbi:MAG: glycosyltransferase [Patescibacteria group bacterium]
MKVISIGTDRKLFEEGSQVLLRNLEYAKRMEELHIVVFTTRKEKHEFKSFGNLHIYPTNSISQWLYVLDAIFLVKNIFKSSGKNDDIVISTQDIFQTGFVGLVISKFFEVPLQIQVHTDYLSSEFKKSFFNLVRVFIASIVVHGASRIRAVSSVVRDSIVKKYPKLADKIDILPVFISIEKIINTIPARNLGTEFPEFKFIVLMASRLEKEKNIDTAIVAFKKVLEKYPQTGLVIAGEGSERKNLESISSKIGINKNVRFIGWEKDLISLYKTADLFLLTSKYEGYGMTLIEAGASGCPIVTTKVGLAKTDLFVNKINSVICETFDDICISDAVINTIENNQAREERKHKMQNDIRSIALTFQDYVNLYIEYLNKTAK